MPAASSESSLARIAYVTNTWWPKVDGAAIAVAGHVRHFVAAGHPVLVVRPSFAADSPLTCRTHASGDRTDPMPPTPLLTFVTFRMTGTRGGGYEPGIVLSDFGRVERAILAWAPDILLVADPDLFMVDTHRLPGFNSLMRGGRRPTTIASFTTFMAEAVMKMPEYWWVHVLGLKPMLETGIAVSYGAFDHVFVNGHHTLAYLAQLRVPLHNGASRRLGAHAQVVASRGVSRSFCAEVAEATCATLPAVQAMVRRAADGAVLPFVFVGRLAHDKSIDELLRSFELALGLLEQDRPEAGSSAHRQPPEPEAGAEELAPVLYVAGSGALEWLVREYAARLPGRVVYLGQVAHAQVPCVLRRAELYVSAAHNETYGRSLVEALRCGLPIVTMGCSNLHVRHEENGLLGSDESQLAAQIRRVVRDGALRRRLKASVTRAQAPADPNAQMLATLLDVHQNGARLQVTSWHPVWSHYMLLSVAVDQPERACVLLVALATLVALAVRTFAPCCRPPCDAPPCDAAAQGHATPRKAPRRSHSPSRLKEDKAD